MYTRVTLNIKTSTPTNEAKGAQVVLTNIDGNSEHIYTDINISLKGFNNYTAESEDFSTENSYEKSSYVLQEYIVNPFNLEVVKTDNEQERMFKWNVSEHLFDDFETHTDFVINSAGNIGWTYIDGDGQETYGIDDVDYINATLPKAYMIFNPYATDPNIALFDSNIRPRSGEKYLASFPARPGANNDFIISPELNFNRDFILKFYAKSYTEDYGKELMNVGYSVTGNDATDFIWLNGENPIEVPMGNWTEY